MNMPPVPETPRKDRLRKLGVFLGTLIILVSLPTIAFQEYTSNRSQNDHHAASASQQALIIKLVMEVKTAQTDHNATLDEIKSLATAVNSVIAGLPAADTYLGKLALGLESQVQALCTATHANCPTLSITSP